MGQFSFICQDTGKAIRESYGCDNIKLTTAYMHDNKGNIWEEFMYNGYGDFGGKDFFQLMAEMNNVEGLNGNPDHDRTFGISLYFGESAIINKTNGKVLKGRGKDFFSWDSDILPHRLTANQSIESGEWYSTTIMKEGLLYPNLTRKKEWTWRNERPEDDPNQGWGE